MMDMLLTQALTQSAATKRKPTQQTESLSKEAKMVGIQQKQMDRAYEFARMVAAAGKEPSQVSERRIRCL